jgi:hypothetical protein
MFNERFEEGVDVHPLGDAVIGYGRLGDSAKMGSILPYLLLYMLSALAVLFLEAKRRLLVLLTAAAVFGFMMPQLLFTQHPAFRYFVQAAHAASWMTLIHAWVLLEGSLGSPEFVASLKAAAARLPGARAARAPGGPAN